MFFILRILLERRIGAYFRGKARRPLIIIGALLPRCQSHSRRREFVPFSDAFFNGEETNLPQGKGKKVSRSSCSRVDCFIESGLKGCWFETVWVFLLKTMAVYWIIGFYYILLLVSMDCNVPGWWLKTKAELHVKASSWIRSSQMDDDDSLLISFEESKCKNTPTDTFVVVHGEGSSPSQRSTKIYMLSYRHAAISQIEAYIHVC